jgi:hypothetical protein
MNVSEEEICFILMHVNLSSKGEILVLPIPFSDKLRADFERYLSDVTDRQLPCVVEYRLIWVVGRSMFVLHSALETYMP